jgi:hypothetical protein
MVKGRKNYYFFSHQSFILYEEKQLPFDSEHLHDEAQFHLHEVRGIRTNLCSAMFFCQVFVDLIDLFVLPSPAHSMISQTTFTWNLLLRNRSRDAGRQLSSAISPLRQNSLLWRQNTWLDSDSDSFIITLSRQKNA